MPQGPDQDLMEILALLSEATKKMTEILLGGTPITTSGGVVSLPTPASAPTESQARSPLDRIQQYEPGPAAQAATEGRPRKRGRFKISDEELKRMYLEKGMTAREIGEIFGVAAGTVAQKVMKLGLSKRGTSPKKGKEKSKG